jgi:hypothetical protein
MVESKKRAYMSPGLLVVELKQRYNLLGCSSGSSGECTDPVFHGIGMAAPDDSEENV